MEFSGYDPNLLLKSLGSFWTTIFKDQDVLRSTASGLKIKLADEYFRFCEIMLGESIHDIPVFNKKSWTNVVFKESEIDQDVEDALLYGDDDLLYGGAALYGGKRPDSLMSFKLPDEIISIGEFICNKIYNPSLVLNKYVDFEVENGVVHFKSNIFENSLIPKREIIDENGNVVDREVSLWIPIAYLDKEYLWRRFGVLTGVYQKSSDEYKSLLTNIFSMFYNGPKKSLIAGYVNQIFGLPVTKDFVEQVNYIEDDIENDTVTITTSSNKYTVSPISAYNTSIREGDQVVQFTPLTNIVSIYDEKDNPGWWKNKQYFSISRKFLDSRYLSGVVVKSENVFFENKVGARANMPLIGEFTEEFEQDLKGFPMHIGMDITVGDPYVKINTMDYFVGQMKDNIIGIKIDPTLIDIPAVPSDFFDILHRIFPVNISYIIFLEIETIEDIYYTDDSTSSIELFTGAVLSDKILTEVDIQDGHYGVASVSSGITVGGFKVGQVLQMDRPLLQVVKKNQ